MTTTEAPQQTNWLKQLAVLVGFILICQMIGASSAVITYPEIRGWYAELVQPALRPPNWVFGPVWTTLYAMMATSAFLIWQQRKTDPKRVKIALMVFGLQLLLNSLWSWIFFYFHNLLGAAIEIVALEISIIATILAFYPIKKLAAYLLLPYLAWVSFATYLTFSFYLLN